MESKSGFEIVTQLADTKKAHLPIHSSGHKLVWTEVRNIRISVTRFKSKQKPSSLVNSSTGDSTKDRQILEEPLSHTGICKARNNARKTLNNLPLNGASSPNLCPTSVDNVLLYLAALGPANEKNTNYPLRLNPAFILTWKKIAKCFRSYRIRKQNLWGSWEQWGITLGQQWACNKDMR